MPRLSMYHPSKSANYRFIDRQISQMFQVGGTDCYVHKYLGSNTDEENATADQPHYATTAVTNIQDLLFLENRDRKYDEEIYRIRGIYNVQNIDFNLSQFGLFIDNDTIYMMVHINDYINYLGRKPLTGDVIELPHLRDDFALNDYDMSLPRYYVIEDVGRASDGFSATWYPHLYKLKLKKVTDSQQFADIFNKPALDANGDPTDTTLRELLSTNMKELEINDNIINQAEADAPMSGYETRQFYTLAVDPESGKPVLETSGNTITNGVPVRSGYSGYLMGDGFPVNGYDFGHGIQFPANATHNDFFLRIDFMPNRLFRFDTNKWIRVEDAVRMNMTNNDSRQTLKTSFINNNSYIYFDEVITDYISLVEGIDVIDTNIDYTTGLYVLLKKDTLELDFVVSEHPLLLEDNNGNLTLNLPVPIPETGQWKIGLYNSREAQRQSLSKALKPKADL
jgi:hypothetical protein